MEHFYVSLVIGFLDTVWKKSGENPSPATLKKANSGLVI